MLEIKVKIQNTWYNVQDCELSYSKLFIFGDNILRVGKGGQAVIRDCYNSTGIATKFKPTMDDDAFFSDSQYENCCEIILQDIMKIKKRIEIGDFDEVVFPIDGLGTGLARLKDFAPNVFKFLAASLKKEFGIDTLPNGKLFLKENK